MNPNFNGSLELFMTLLGDGPRKSVQYVPFTKFYDLKKKRTWETEYSVQKLFSKVIS